MDKQGMDEDDVEKLSSCCSWPVLDLAGEGVGGIDICPDCGEWCDIVAAE